MKKLLAVALALIVLSPALTFAGSSTDAALGLGAFAVFNQMLSGTGIFGGLLGQPAIVAPVVVAPPPPVVIVRPAPVVSLSGWDDAEDLKAAGRGSHGWSSRRLSPDAVSG